MPPSSSSCNLSTPCAPMTGLPSSGSASARLASARRRHRHEHGDRPLVGQPGLGRARPRAAARGALRRAGRRRQRQSRGRPGRADVLPPASAQQPDRDQGGSRGRRRDHPQRPAVPGRWLWRGRVRPRLDGRRRRRAVPLRARRAASRPWRACARWSTPPAPSSHRSPTRRGLVAAFLAGVDRHPADRPRCRARARGRDRLADRRAQRPPRPAGRAGRGVRRRLARRGPPPARSSVLALLARDTQIEFGHVHDDVVVLGASALLMEQQLGLGLVR